MSKETGSSLSRFKNESIKKGRNALTFSTRAATPALVIGGILGTAAGTILLGMHGQADKEFSPRVKIEIAVILLSLAIFSAPFVGKKMVDKLKKNKAKVNSPEPTDP